MRTFTLIILSSLVLSLNCYADKRLDKIQLLDDDITQRYSDKDAHFYSSRVFLPLSSWRKIGFSSYLYAPHTIRPYVTRFISEEQASNVDSIIADIENVVRNHENADEIARSEYKILPALQVTELNIEAANIMGNTINEMLIYPFDFRRSSGSDLVFICLDRTFHKYENFQTLMSILRNTLPKHGLKNVKAGFTVSYEFPFKTDISKWEKVKTTVAENVHWTANEVVDQFSKGAEISWGTKKSDTHLIRELKKKRPDIFKAIAEFQNEVLARFCQN